MAAQQNFRSAFNGFNREDVVRYLEFINAKHVSQVNQLTTENEELRTQLAACPGEDQLALLEQLQQRCAELEERLGESEAQKTHLEEALAQLQQQLEAQSEAAPAADPSAELEAYRRAERAEREARERAELVYYQANGVLTEATAKVDGISAEITDMADQVMAQLTQLQVAVSSSKQALQDASSIMNIIRPNK